MSAPSPAPAAGAATRWAIPVALGAVVTAAVALIYAPALGVPFVYDDLAEIVSNRALHDLSDPAAVVAYNPARALLLLIFAVEWRLWGADPLPFHVTSIAVHLAACALVAALTRRMMRGRLPPGNPQARRLDGASLAPFAAALLFAVHPLFVETVTYIASRSSSLATVFYVSTVLAFSRYRDAQARRAPAARWYAATLGMMVLAVATKEIAATLPAALLLFDVTLAPRGDGASGPGRLRAALPHIAPWLILLIMVGLRLHFFGSVSQGTPVRTVPENLLTEAGVVVGYLYRFIVPFPLSIYHDVPTVTAPTAATLGAMALHAAIIGVGLRLAFRGSAAGFALLWVYLTLIPSSSIIPLKEAMAEHRTYLPGAGLMAGVGWGLAQVHGRRGGRVAWVAAGLATALFAGMTLSYNRIWTDEIRLWRHATELAPHSGDAFYALGDAYRRQDRLDDAIDAYQRSIRNYEDRGIHLKSPKSTKIVYNYPDALNNLGLAYAMKGEVDRAIAQFRLAARSYPSLGGQAWTNLGYALMIKGQHEAAERALTTAVEVEPTNVLAHLHLANLYYAFLADRQKSLTHYRAALALAPDLPDRAAIEERILELSF